MLKKLLFACLILISVITPNLSEAAQSLNLKSGFNFVGFTVTPDVSAFQLIQSYPAIDDIYLFSASAGSFLSFKEGTLSTLSAGKGYIIKTSTAFTANISGNALSTIGNISLKTGFNLVGFSKMPETITASALMARNQLIKGIYKWSSSSGSFIQVLKNASGGADTPDGIDPTIKAAESCFIQITSDTTINYDGASASVGGSTVNPPVNPPVTGAASGHIVYDYWVNGTPKIYAMNADGSGIVKLTDGTGGDTYPCLSPDDSKIAFISTRSGNKEIYSMNSDGSNVVKLTSFNDPAVTLEHLDYSPAGQHLIFTYAKDKTNQIKRISASDGSGMTALGNTAYSAFFPRYSPDGSKIAFNSGRDGYVEVFVMNSDGTGEKKIGSGSIRSAAFTTDGSRFIYNAGGTDFVSCAVASYGVKFFKFPGLYIGSISMSADGKKMAIYGYTGDSASSANGIYTGGLDFLSGESYSTIPSSNFTKIGPAGNHAVFSHTSRGVTAVTNGPGLSSIAVDNPVKSIYTGTDINLRSFRVVANYGDGRKADVTWTATWEQVSGTGTLGGAAYLTSAKPETVKFKVSYKEGIDVKTADATLNVIDRFPVAVDEIEPNDTMEQAQTIPTDQTVECSLGYYIPSQDKFDWFKFTLPADGPVTLKRYPLVNFVIFHADGVTSEKLVYWGDTIYDEESINLKAGTYYVKALSNGGKACVYPLFVKTKPAQTSDHKIISFMFDKTTDTVQPGGTYDLSKITLTVKYYDGSSVVLDSSKVAWDIYRVGGGSGSISGNTFYAADPGVSVPVQARYETPFYTYTSNNTLNLSTAASASSPNGGFNR